MATVLVEMLPTTVAADCPLSRRGVLGPFSDSYFRAIWGPRLEGWASQGAEDGHNMSAVMPAYFTPLIITGRLQR